eukprot:10290614-Prorocentrum_lima.AAC.1
MCPIRATAPSHFRNGSSERGSGVGSLSGTGWSYQWWCGWPRTITPTCMAYTRGRQNKLSQWSGN